jgi:hypothetical protein
MREGETEDKGTGTERRQGTCEVEKQWTEGQEKQSGDKGHVRQRDRRQNDRRDRAGTGHVR